MLVSASFYGANHFVFKALWDTALIHNYANDLFAMPFLLAYSNILIRISGKPEWAFTSLNRVALLTMHCAFVWEYLAPQILKHSVPDRWDVVAYCVGAVVYWGGCRRFGTDAASSHTMTPYLPQCQTNGPGIPPTRKTSAGRTPRDP
jgi:hypothetical protein